MRIRSDPKHTSSLVKHGGGVKACARKAASGPGSPIFINKVSHGSSRNNSEVYISILSAKLQRNASKLIENNFILQQDNATKHISNTKKDFIRTKGEKF